MVEFVLFSRSLIDKFFENIYVENLYGLVCGIYKQLDVCILICDCFKCYVFYYVLFIFFSKGGNLLIDVYSLKMFEMNRFEE